MRSKRLGHAWRFSRRKWIVGGVSFALGALWVVSWASSGWGSVESRGRALMSAAVDLSVCKTSFDPHVGELLGESL